MLPTLILPGMLLTFAFAGLNSPMIHILSASLLLKGFIGLAEVGFVELYRYGQGRKRRLLPIDPHVDVGFICFRSNPLYLSLPLAARHLPPMPDHYHSDVVDESGKAHW